MAVEHEQKFRIDDPAVIRQRLATLQAVGEGRVLEVNQILDTPNGRLHSADCGLRVRQTSPLEAGPAAGVTLTFKGPRTEGDLKSREEIELTVDDATAAVDLLGRLGFQVAVAFEKRRETYALGGCVVTVDELPRLGWCVEIEGPDAAQIERVRGQLGLESAAPVRQTYVELAAALGEADASGCRRLTFPPT